MANNLIVNYLPHTCTEEQLKEIFSPYGEVETVKIVKEKGTQRSLGYGFVKFINENEAAEAIKGLNGKQMENKTLKVAISRPPGSEKLCNLYVAGLEPHITKDDLKTIFQTYGNVTETKVLHEKSTGASRGIGFVKFEFPEQASKAIEGLNGVTLAGTSKPLTVRVAEKKDSPLSLSNPLSLSPVSPLALSHPHFQNQRNNARFNPMGYFPQPFPQPFPVLQQGGQVPGGVTLFVYNLPAESDESYLYQLFGPYGAIIQVRIVRDPGTSQCKGYGFVNMQKVEDASNAINALNGALLGNKTLQVSFKKEK